MHAFPVPVLPSLPTQPRTRQRTALVASADRSFRQRLTQILTGLRWQVREASGGAEAWAEAEASLPEALIVDSWLPDLDLNEFLSDFRGGFPGVDVLTAAASKRGRARADPTGRNCLRSRNGQENDTTAWNTAPAMSAARGVVELPKPTRSGEPIATTDATGFVRPAAPAAAGLAAGAPKTIPIRSGLLEPAAEPFAERLPTLVGNAACMLEVSRRVRLVAPRLTPVLIEGPTGSGKELVAEALHRLSPRSRKPMVAINCAAIPEALLEAELFGHTRGAFTGAVQGRVGRIESANGGTLFLDEIGEMPLVLQSKLLRFVECGELQRVGDNETVRVDVRIIAASHRPLASQAQSGGFRSDLYYRLAVFLIRTPALSEHAQDLPLLIEHFLGKLGRDAPMKGVDEGARAKLAAHDWPGNVRELEHVLERGMILAGDNPVLTTREIDFGLSMD